MRRLRADAIQLNDTHAPAADTAAIVTIAADADQFWVLSSIHYGYDKAPGGAETLTVAFGGVTKFTAYIPNDIKAAGPHPILLPEGGLFNPSTTAPNEGVKNEAMVVTLSAATGTCKGSVNITYR